MSRRSNRSRARFSFLERLENRVLLDAALADLTQKWFSSAPAPTAYQDNVALVRLANSASPDLLGAYGAKVESTSVADLWQLRFASAEDLQSGLHALNDCTWVVSASPMQEMSVELTPNDSLFTSLWGMNNTGQSGGLADADIDAPQAWDRRVDAMSVVVADIDTGIDYRHPDLYKNIWINQGEIPATRRANLTDLDSDGIITFWDLNNPVNIGVGKITDLNANGYIDGGDLLTAMTKLNGVDTGNGGWANAVSDEVGGDPFIDDIIGWDFVNGDNNPIDDHNHGTHTTGTIAGMGNNGVGVAGTAWKAQIMPLKFLSATGSGSDLGAAYAIAYSVLKGAKLSSNSWGGDASDVMFDAISDGRDAGQLFIAAAGNNGRNADTAPLFPAGYSLDNIVSVAATDRNDLLASFSNYGVVSVDLGAPGVAINSTVRNGGYSSFSGTSMATPHVSGAAALVMAQRPSWDYLQVKAHLMASVDPIASLAGKTVTGGRLNLQKALANVAPTDLALSNDKVAENEAISTMVGAFTTTDPDVNDTFTYTLAAGTGDSDNASFTIDSGVLKTSASFDFETKSSYAIRVRSSDAGGLFTEKEFTIQVTDVGESAPPVLGGITGAAAVTYKENAIPLLISSAATVTDPDSPNYGGGVLTVWLSSNATADDRLSIKHLGDTAGKIGVDYVTKTIRYGNVPIATYTGGDGANTFVITFNGSAGTAAVQAALRAITFENVSHSPSALARTASFQLADNGGGVSTVATRTINVTPVIDKPVVTVTNSTVEYLEGAAPILIDGGVSVSDLDSPNFDLGKLIVKSAIGGESSDRFGITPSGVITVSGSTVNYNGTPIGTFAGTSSLTVTLNSNANAANVQELARRIAFWNISGTPSATPRQISFSVSDGDGGTSLAALGDTVNVTPVNIDPVLTLSNLTAATYTENALPVLISSSATVVDVDLLNFDGGALTVAITDNGEASDELSVKHTPPASGKVSVNYPTGAISYMNGSLQTYQVATFTGGQGDDPLVILFNTSALKTEVQAVMRAITFASRSDNPSTAQRTVTFTLTDGDGGTSDPVIRSVNVVAKNDAPGVGAFGGDANYSLSGSPVVITDSATVVDPDSPDFSGGKLTVALGANRSSLDRVEVSDGNGITVSGNVVSYNGNAIGTFAGTTTLVVTFNSAFATPDAVQALLRQLTFRTTALTARVVTVTAKVTDGDGGTSPIVSKLINVTN